MSLFANALFRGAIGMAAIGIALWKYVMRYAPHNPTYFNRDRFVLSNGKSDERVAICV
jgi:transketolase